eukprot:1096833-Pyramimonas_sp.AAC.1
MLHHSWPLEGKEGRDDCELGIASAKQVGIPCPQAANYLRQRSFTSSGASKQQLMQRLLLRTQTPPPAMCHPTLRLAELRERLGAPHTGEASDAPASLAASGSRNQSLESLGSPTLFGSPAGSPHAPPRDIEGSAGLRRSIKKLS